MCELAGKYNQWANFAQLRKADKRQDLEGVNFCA